MKILKAKVLIETGSTDRVELQTDLPNAFPIYASEPQYVSLDVLAGRGVRYVKDNFSDVTDIETINLKTGERSRC